MRRITEITPRPGKKQGCQVILDDGSCYLLDTETLARCRLRSGQEVDPGQLSVWIRDSEIRQAYDLSLKYLGYRARSCRELAAYLERKSFGTQVVEAVITKLQDYGFMDDASFAERWVRSRKAGRPVGKRMIAHELKSKGIADDMIEDALSAFTDEEQEDQALVLGRKYYVRCKGLPPREQAAKIGQALVRRGFDWGTAQRVIRRLLAVELEDS